MPDVLETSSLFHVALLVFLRLFAISQPMNYEETHIKLRYNGIVIIWIISVGVRLTALLTQRFALHFYLNYRIITVLISHTAPIICIVTMYVTSIWILKRSRNASRDATLGNLSANCANSMDKKMTLMVQRIVTFLIVCHLPYMAWCIYFDKISIERKPFKMTQPEVIRYTKSYLTLTGINSTYDISKYSVRLAIIFFF